MGEESNGTANSRRPPRTVDVKVPDGAGPMAITRDILQQISTVVHQIAPAVRIRLAQPPRALQSTEQPPPYTAADEARATLVAGRGWMRT